MIDLEMSSRMEKETTDFIIFPFVQAVFYSFLHERLILYTTLDFTYLDHTMQIK